jgi:hypothetical protein
MLTSQEIDKLVGALAKARGGFPEIPRNEQANTGIYTYSYADLADVLAAVTPSLSAHELAILGGVENDEQGNVVVTVRLAHVSGQWTESRLSIGKWGKMQDLGGSLTYARRYLTCAVLGVQPGGEDNDGQDDAGDARAPKTAKRQAAASTKHPSTPTAQPTVPKDNPDAGRCGELIKEASDFLILAKGDRETKLKATKDAFGVEWKDRGKLTVAQLEAGLKKLKEQFPPEPPAEQSSQASTNGTEMASGPQLSQLKSHAADVGGDWPLTIQSTLDEHEQVVALPVYQRLLDKVLAAKAEKEALAKEGISV